MGQSARLGVTETEQRLLRNAPWLGAGDQPILTLPQARRVYVETAVESYRQGAQANVEEALILASAGLFI